MARPVRLTAQALAVLLVAGLLGLLIWRVATAHGRPTSGKAPAYSLERLDGSGKLELASLRGKGVVLNFWASWCVPCKKEARLLEAAWRKDRGRGLVIVGIDAQDFERDARRFARRFGLTYPLVRDTNGSTLSDYGITGFPETFFVDRKGRLVGKHIEGAIQAGQNGEIFRRGVELALARTS